MADAVRTNVGTNDTGNADRRIRAVLRDPAQEEPFNTPMLRALTNLAQRRKAPLTARGYKLEWFTQARFLRFVTVGSTAPTTGTSIIVTDTSYIQPGHVLSFQKEMILVTAVNTGTLTLTVVRDVTSNGFTASIPAGVQLHLVTSAAEQGEAKGPRMAKHPTLAFNFTQIIRRGTGITRTQMQTDQYHASDELEYQVRLAKTEIEEEWERAGLMNTGKAQILPGASGATDHPRTIMGGLPTFITTNRINAGGSMTYEDLDDYMQGIVRFGGNRRKVLMGGQGFGTLFNSMPSSAIRTTTRSNFWGREITTLGGAGWTADFIPNWQLEGTDWANTLYVLDFEYIFAEFLQRLDVDPNTADPGKDAKEVELLMEAGLIVQNEKAHGMIEEAFS
jgi:hypothetical protein